MKKLLSLMALLSMTVNASESLPTIDPSLYKLRIDLPQKTLYELVPTKEGLGWSIIIADIEQVELQFHEYTLETYSILEGILEFTLDGEKHVLYPGDVISIPLNTAYSAKSLIDTPVRISVTAVPGWTPEDYHPL